MCGFDLLRSESGQSYVCDVNGFSLVKNSTRFYADAAGILRSIILSRLAPHRLTAVPRQVHGDAAAVLAGVRSMIAVTIAMRVGVSANGRQYG